MRVGWDPVCRVLEGQAIVSSTTGILPHRGFRGSRMSHPTMELLEATVRGALPAAEARAIRAHAAGCPACSSFLVEDQDVHRRLALLSDGMPTIDVAAHVMSHLDEAERSRVGRWVPRAALALTLIVAGVLVASNGYLRRTARRLGSIAPL